MALFSGLKGRSRILRNRFVTLVGPLLADLRVGPGLRRVIHSVVIRAVIVVAVAHSFAMFDFNVPPTLLALLSARFVSRLSL